MYTEKWKKFLEEYVEEEGKTMTEMSAAGAGGLHGALGSYKEELEEEEETVVGENPLDTFEGVQEEEGLTDEELEAAKKLEERSFEY
jgi:hypothetical protein